MSNSIRERRALKFSCDGVEVPILEPPHGGRTTDGKMYSRGPSVKSKQNLQKSDFLQENPGI